MKKKSTQFRWLVTMLLLVTAMAMPKMAWAGITPKQPSGYGTADSPYQIGTAEELYWFAALVNGELEGVSQNTSANAKLTADITVNNEVLISDGTLNNNGSGFETWTPIGFNGEYTGTFDGQGHTISGLYFNDVDAFMVGLFGINQGTIKNVGVVDSYFCGNELVGGVCGFNTEGTITGCFNTGSVSGSYAVGGVCGVNGGTITGCHNTGSVSGNSNNVGGVCGRNNVGGKITGCYNSGKVSGNDWVGGVCGVNGGTITGCYNTGTVKGSGNDWVGGVCGLNDGGTITGCYNKGTVSGYNSVGGVCGSNDGGTITGCYNTGTVSGGRVGGVCGNNENYGTITGCYNTGMVKGSGYYVGGVCGNNKGGTITGCYNTGAVSGSISMVQVGGVCGFNEGGTITGCYTNNGGVCDNNEGTITDCEVVESDHDFTNGALCSLLNTALKNANASVRFYQGGYYPELFMNVPSLVEGVYQISNKEDLYAFALVVNKNVETSANAVLTADITVNTGVLKSDRTLADNYSDFETWTPIGNNQKPYTGTFDGQGHTISGLYFNDVDASYVGLFGGNCGTIKNVGVVDSYFYGSDLVGGVCGWTYKSTLENCYNKGTVSSKGYAGGICGSVSEGTIRDCYNTGSVNGTWYVGGVCGLVSDEDDKSYIINCYNTGDVKGGSQDLCCTGGVCGVFTCSIGSNCYNTGTVGATAGNIGAVFGNTEEAYFNNCYYLEDCNAEGVSFTNEFGTKMSSAAFGSGEVAYLLSQGSTVSDGENTTYYSGSVWGQQLGTDDYPVLSDYKVIKAAKGDKDANENDTYWATFSNLKSDATLSVPSARNLNVYNATVGSGTMTLKKRTDNQVAKEEGVLLKTDGEYVNVKANATDGLNKVEYANNNLVATPATEDIISAGAGYTLYRLTYNNVSTMKGLGFYLGLVKNADGSVASNDGSQLKATPGKAYLKVTTEVATKPSNAAPARGFAFPGDDDTTGIGEIVIEGDAGISGSANANDRIYNLQGQQVTAPVKGLYIKNNKKVVIK